MRAVPGRRVRPTRPSFEHCEWPSGRRRDRGRRAAARAAGETAGRRCGPARWRPRRGRWPALSRVSAISCRNAASAAVDVVGPPGVGERDRGGDDDARFGIGQVTTHEDRGVFVFELGECPQCRGADVHVLVLHHARDGRHPSAGCRLTATAPEPAASGPARARIDAAGAAASPDGACPAPRACRSRTTPRTRRGARVLRPAFRLWPGPLRCESRWARSCARRCWRGTRAGTHATPRAPRQSRPRS